MELPLLIINRSEASYGVEDVVSQDFQSEDWARVDIEI